MITNEYGTRIEGGIGPTDYVLIDTDMLDALRRYIFEAIPPGDFLMAVLCNDLKEAVGRADHRNIGAIPAYVALLYNDAPGTCWGSEEKVQAWLLRS